LDVAWNEEWKMPAIKKKQAQFDVELDDLEEKFRSHFNPVKPDPKFVDHLQHRLTVEPDVIIDQPPRPLLIMLIIGAGLFTGALAIWIIHKIRES
jgi:hypothetical protein